MKYKEKWKLIDGFGDKYQISSFGRIRRSGDKMILCTQTSQKGYKHICLYYKGKVNCWIHRLVARAFLPNPDSLTDIDHIDGDKSNNNINNLEWVSHSENIRRALQLGFISKDHIGKFMKGEK